MHTHTHKILGSKQLIRMKKTEKVFADKKKKKNSDEQSISQNEKKKKNLSVETINVTNFHLLSEVMGMSTMADSRSSWLVCSRCLLTWKLL